MKPSAQRSFPPPRYPTDFDRFGATGHCNFLRAVFSSESRPRVEPTTDTLLPRCQCHRTTRRSTPPRNCSPPRKRAYPHQIFSYRISGAWRRGAARLWAQGESRKKNFFFQNGRHFFPLQRRSFAPRRRPNLSSEFRFLGDDAPFRATLRRGRAQNARRRVRNLQWEVMLFLIQTVGVRKNTPMW